MKMRQARRGTAATALALLLAVLGVSPAAADSTVVTTNAYSATSTSTDVDASCKDLDMSSTGTLSGTCNTSGSTNDSTLDMTGNIACGASAGLSTAIAWRTSQNQYFKVTEWDIVLNSTGTKYLVEAKCKSRYTSATAGASTLELGDGTNGVDNDSGDLGF